MLLIVTNKQDPHADEVIRCMARRDLPLLRLNTEDILTKYTFSLRVLPGQHPDDAFLHQDGDLAAGQTGSGRARIWCGHVRDEVGRDVPLERVSVAWIRRPEYLFDGARDGQQKFIASEVRALMNSLYALPHITFINDVFNGDRARTKFQQLIYAAGKGMKVPRTIITNSPEEAEAFAAAATGDLLVKVLQTGNVERGGVKHGLPSQRVKRAGFAALSPLVRNAPTQIQDYIEKAFEVRATIIGDKVHAVRIDSQQNEMTKVDWRPHTALNPHSITTMPKRVEAFCRTFLKDQGLLYGAMDFIVEPDGSYVFLENNVSGQFLWLQRETGIPIVESLVDLISDLVRGARQPVASATRALVPFGRLSTSPGRQAG
ncbi:MAG TPA: hypothetical protein VFA75_00395 [Nevskia sp.]|nr:hypothetical protein [Nevskia sp.]